MGIKNYENAILQLHDAEDIYIYGAGDVAKEVYFCLTQEPYNLKIRYFLVTSLTESIPENIDGIKVLSYDDEIVSKYGVVVVAVLEKYRDEICRNLDSLGMKKRIILSFESDLWSEIRRKQFEKYSEKKGYPYLFWDDLYTGNVLSKNEGKEYRVYVTRSTKDKPLNNPFKCRSWEQEILAGAALNCGETIYARDDIGENISHKNRKYCELTAMYWMWKNVTHEYIGLSHYRRRFDFEVEELGRLCNGETDAILTTPVINVPNVKYMYEKNHVSYDWIVMKDVVDGLCSEYSTALSVVEHSNFYVPYNMFIMKQSVFNEYCEWLFPILEECEKIIGDKEDTYQNRYIGFLAERLMTVYFYKNRDSLNTVFCNKLFLE